MSTQGSESVHVAIVGGGITGLSTAWYLQQKAAEAGLNLTYTLLEKSDHHWGGKIKTDHVDGYGDEPFVVEGGPDSFITQKPWGFQLARELGLEDDLLGTNDHKRNVFVLTKGKPVILPDGVLLIVPTKFMPFALSPLISLLGKIRMGMDLFIPARRDGKDETLADFVRRRLGNEALDKIAEPLMSGIYNAEAEKQSLLATFPRFRKLEEDHGSLVRGMLASRRARKTAPPSPNGAKKPPSMFVSLKTGTRKLVEALTAKLTGDLRLNATVTGITRAGSGYRLSLADGTAVEADTVVLASPAFVAGELLKDLAPEASEKLNAIRYVSTGTISLSFRKEDIPTPLDGFGLVIPASEKRPINAVTWSSIKFNHRAPDDHYLLRVFFGGSRSPEMMDVGDEELVPIVLSELKQLLGIDAPPVFHRIYRWHRGNPQYDVGHLEHVKAIEAALPENLYVTGSPYKGIGIPDCVHQAKDTAERMIATLKERAEV